MFKLCLVRRSSGEDMAVNFLDGWTRFVTISSFLEASSLFFLFEVERMVLVPEKG